MASDEKLLELYKNLKRKEIKRLVDITRKLQQKYGPQVADDIAEVLTERIHDKWENMDKGNAGMDELYDLMWDRKKYIMESDVEVKGDNELRLKVNRCFYAEEYKKHDAQDLGYKYCCMTEYPAVDVFNPRIRFRRHNTIMQNNNYCDHCYKIIDKKTNK